MTLRVNLWSGPRNVSTALMYAFGNRTDVHVVDEPLYGHYLRITGAPHPGAIDVMVAMECDGARVVQNVILGDFDPPIVFFKQMAHHLVELDWGFLKQTENVILTRSPREMIPSLAKNIAQPTLRDTGFARQVEIFDYLTQSGKAVPVVDSTQLLLDPSSVLHQLCERLGIPFDDAMLRWPAGPKSEDGAWARHWYRNVHTSTGFRPYRPKTEPFPPEFESLLKECLPYYERLLEHAIRAEN